MRTDELPPEKGKLTHGFEHSPRAKKLGPTEASRIVVYGDFAEHGTSALGFFNELHTHGAARHGKPYFLSNASLHESEVTVHVENGQPK